MQPLMFLLLFLFQTAPQDTATIDSEIQSATVYLSGAEVHRQTTLTLQPGSNRIVFTGLSHSLNEETIQLQAEGDIVLESISKSINENYKGVLADKIDSLKTQKEKTEKTIQQKQAAMTVLDRKLSVLQTNQDLSGDNTKLSAAELKQAMDYFSGQFEEIETRRIELNNELKKLNQELNEINKEINTLQSQQRQASGAIEMAIGSESKRQVTFNLSYYVPGARWQPSYDVRVEDTGQPLNLIYKANISQNTGVNWNDVNLTISSARPRFNSTIPTIDPVYLRFFDSEQKLRIRSEMALDEPEQRKLKSEAMPSPVQSQLQQGQTAFIFAIENPYTINSGATKKTISVERYTPPASYRYLTVPKKQPVAYLTAKVDDWESLHLLPGQANLFLDQSFVGKTQINASAVGDTLSFSLGRDERVSIERNQIEEFSEKNFFGNRVTETVGWEIILRNTKSSPVSISVLDQVPVSTNEDIDVDLQERSNASYSEETGRLSWDLDLEPSESRTLRFVYEITYPAGKQLQRTQ